MLDSITVEPGTDTDGFHRAFEAARRVFVPPGTYRVNLDITQNARVLQGCRGAVFVGDAGSNGPVVTIRGRGNHITGIEIAQDRFLRCAIEISGDSTRLSDSTIRCAVPQEGENYYRREKNDLYGYNAIVINSESTGSMVERCEVSHWRGRGIEINGPSATVQDCSIHECWAGIAINPAAHHAKCARNRLFDNHILKQDQFGDDGCDGILLGEGQESTPGASFVVIEQNVIFKSDRQGAMATAEHGIYYQGHAGVIRDNVVSGNPGTGIKLHHGAAETLVVNNRTFDNRTGIWVELAPRLRAGDQSITGNYCEEEDGIRFPHGPTSPAGTPDDRLKRVGNLIIAHNRCQGNLQVRSEKRVIVTGNFVDREILVGGHGDGQPMAGCIITSNICGVLTIANPERHHVAHNFAAGG